MNEQEKKRQRIYDLLKTETKLNFLCLPYTKQKIVFTEKDLFKEKGKWLTEQKLREGFLTAFATVIKKDPTTPIRKHD